MTKRLQNWKWITKACIECGGDFQCRSTARRTQWCPDCNKARKEYRRKGHEKSNRLSKKARKEGKMCEQCGERPGVEMHHKKSLADGGSHSRENLEFLCGICHDLEHYEEPKLNRPNRRQWDENS